MRIIFIGPPGAGKGTQSQRLLQYLRIPHISTGDMLRQQIAADTPDGRTAASYMSKGQLVPDPVILRMIETRMAQPDCVAGALFDGFPRSVPQAESLGALLERQGTPLDVVLELRVSDEEVMRRLMQRARPDDTPEVLRERLSGYWNVTRPLLDFYGNRGLVRVIDGLGSPDEVFERIKAALKPTAR